MHKNFTNNVKITVAIVLLLISVRQLAAGLVDKQILQRQIFVQDTIPAKKPNVNSPVKKDISDTTNNNNDSVKVAKIDTLLLSKDSLDAPVKYVASDSGVLKLKSREFLLYGKADVKYKDIELEAATIAVSYTHLTLPTNREV